jgi:hypothetical protein
LENIFLDGFRELLHLLEIVGGIVDHLGDAERILFQGEAILPDITVKGIMDLRFLDSKTKNAHFFSKK